MSELCNPKNCTPGLPVHHQLPEFTQTHVHRVSDAISHLILCCPLLLLLPIPPSNRVFSNESTLRMRWPKYWNFSFSIIPSKEHPGLISFRMDLLDLLAVQGTLTASHRWHLRRSPGNQQEETHQVSVKNHRALLSVLVHIFLAYYLHKHFFFFVMSQW